MENNERRESIRFSDAVGPGQTETQTVEVTQDCTVEQVVVRIYSGPRLDLRVTPFVEHGDDGRRRRTNLVRTEGKPYIDGDDDQFTFETEEPLRDGERIGVTVENNDDANSYDFAVDVTIDRAGGIYSRLSSAVGRVKGWF